MNMEMRMDQRQQPRQRANQMRQQTMQARQSQLNEVIARQNDTAVILERVAGRLDALEHWREDQDRRMERQEDRRDERDDKRPDASRATIAIVISACIGGLSLLEAMVGLVYIVTQHWK